MTSSQPLQGLRILVTRARNQAGALSSRLKEMGAEVIEIPIIEIRPPESFSSLDEALDSLDSYDWLILTSANGAEALLSRMGDRSISVDALGRLRIAAIGPATRRSLEAQGLRVEVVPRNYVAEDVVLALRDRVAGCRVLLVRAKVARDVIPRELAQAGAAIDVVDAYETVSPEGTEAALAAIFSDPRHRPEVVCLTSSSTAQNLLTAAPEAARLIREGTLLCACIGPITSKAVLEHGLPVAVEATEYTVDGLIDAIAEYFASRSKAGDRS